MRVADALNGVVRLGFDTSPFIHFVEQTPAYFLVCEPFIRAVDSQSIAGYTSTITLTETLVKPLQTNDLQLAADYRAFFNSGSLNLVSITAAVADKAADLRVRYNLRIADALQVATAISVGCDAFLTGDTGIRRVTEMKILVLNDLTI